MKTLASACERMFGHPPASAADQLDRSIADKSFLRLAALRSSECGQATVLVCVCMVVLIGFLGLAIDVGNLRFTKKKLQVAADAAALAGALEVKQCGGTAACSAMINAAKQSLAENNFANPTVVTNCSTTSVPGLKLMLNNGPCAIGSADPNAGKTDHVEAVVTQPTPLYFASVFGYKSFPITARSEAARASGANCMFALDPTGGNAITVDLLASVSGSCGIVDESSASNALSCNLLASINVSQIGVVGGVQNFLCSITPTPKTHIPVPDPADPLATLPKPAVLPCGTSTSSPYHGSASALNITGTAVLYADASYCGGINILPTAKVTFMPGTYVLTSRNGSVTKSPGGLTIDCGASVTGNGVTFYNYGPTGGITFGFTSLLGFGTTLTAPTSGPYGGILFFQDPQNTSQATILGTTAWNTDIEGAYYFPSAKVVYALSGMANYNILVAYDIEFAVLTFGTTSVKSSGFANDYSSLANGSPVAGSGAVLVQ